MAMEGEDYDRRLYRAAFDLADEIDNDNVLELTSLFVQNFGSAEQNLKPFWHESAEERTRLRPH
jgi:hypothetical protein